MQVLREFPIKDLFLKLFSITALIVSFRIVATRIGQKNSTVIIAAKNSSPKNNHKKLHALEKKHKLVEKFEAHIEEQAFLLSLAEKDDPGFEKRILKIYEKLENIKKEAKTKKVDSLIDQPQIQELKDKIKSHLKIYRSS